MVRPPVQATCREASSYFLLLTSYLQYIIGASTYFPKGRAEPEFGLGNVVGQLDVIEAALAKLFDNEGLVVFKDYNIHI
jgi:hypothetical protein